jgi:pimeloyl-ACP methyl ester carboxylesterase
VLLLGGSLDTDLTMWDAQLALANRLRIVRFDHRGHGDSAVPPRPARSSPYSLTGGRFTAHPPEEIHRGLARLKTALAAR